MAAEKWCQFTPDNFDQIFSYIKPSAVGVWVKYLLKSTEVQISQHWQTITEGTNSTFVAEKYWHCNE